MVVQVVLSEFEAHLATSFGHQILLRLSLFFSGLARGPWYFFTV